MKELINMEQKTKTIYSLRLCEFLLEKGCEMIAVKPHPFKLKFRCFIFLDNEKLQESIAEFMMTKKES